MGVATIYKIKLSIPREPSRACFKTRKLCAKCQYDKLINMRRHELSEAQWNRIKDLLPPERKPQGGRPAKSNREMLNAMMYWLNTGIPRRDLPERFGPWQSVYSRFRVWTKADVWENVLAQLIQQDVIDETTLMLDSTSIKVHQHTSSCKKGGDIESKGRRREGLSM